MSSLPASLKKIFPIISQWVLSVAVENRVLTQSAPKPYAAFSLKVRQKNSKFYGDVEIGWSDLAKFELLREFMPVLVTCKFDEDRIKTEGVRVETSFSTKFSSFKGK